MPDRGGIPMALQLTAAVVAALTLAACVPAQPPDAGRAKPTASPPRVPVEPSTSLQPGAAAPEVYRPRTPARVIFSFGPGVSASDRTFIESTVQQARLFFRSAYGPVLRGTIRVSAEFSFDEMVETFSRRLELPRWIGRLRWATAPAVTARGPWPQATQVFILVARWGSADPVQQAKILFHEWFHVLQYQAPPPNPSRVDPDEVPRWLFEGSAEWWALRAATRLGWYVSFETVRAGQRAIAASATASLPSLRYSVEPAGAPGYALSFVAVDRLALRAGRGAVARFWRTLPRSPSVQEAFADAFGLTLPRFYRRFARWREASLP